MKQNSFYKRYLRGHDAYTTNYRHTFYRLPVSAYCLFDLYGSVNCVLFSSNAPHPSVFIAQGLANEAYTTCSSILAQLGETVPDNVTLEMVGDIIQETLSMYSEVYSDDWLERKMDDTNLRNIVKFYSIFTTAAYFCKQSYAYAPSYFLCRMVQISLRNGVCGYTPLALMKLSLIVFNNSKDNTFSNAALIRYVFH